MTVTPFSEQHKRCTVVLLRPWPVQLFPWPRGVLAAQLLATDSNQELPSAERSGFLPRVTLPAGWGGSTDKSGSVRGGVNSCSPPSLMQRRSEGPSWLRSSSQDGLSPLLQLKPLPLPSCCFHSAQRDPQVHPPAQACTHISRASALAS